MSPKALKSDSLGRVHVNFNLWESRAGVILWKRTHFGRPRSCGTKCRRNLGRSCDWRCCFSGIKKFLVTYYLIKKGREFLGSWWSIWCYHSLWSVHPGKRASDWNESDPQCEHNQRHRLLWTPAVQFWRDRFSTILDRNLGGILNNEPSIFIGLWGAFTAIFTVSLIAFLTRSKPIWPMGCIRFVCWISKRKNKALKIWWKEERFTSHQDLCPPRLQPNSF